jgi:hypothetical protein
LWALHYTRNYKKLLCCFAILPLRMVRQGTCTTLSIGVSFKSRPPQPLRSVLCHIRFAHANSDGRLCVSRVPCKLGAGMCMRELRRRCIEHRLSAAGGTYTCMRMLSVWHKHICSFNFHLASYKAGHKAPHRSRALLLPQSESRSTRSNPVSCWEMSTV